MSNETDEQQILQLFEDRDRALITANVAELKRIYADDYIRVKPWGFESPLSHQSSI